ncbi:MAG: hypothetical protein IT364_02195 [Candidatus Hydrogenedentes bacterium]|nr:hypothetical protein [Candidatus Hydrogenedentota bacterium]
MACFLIWCCALQSAPEETIALPPYHAIRQWDFDTWNSTDGWTVPAPLLGDVNGGALRLRIGRAPDAPFHLPQFPRQYTAIEEWARWVWPMQDAPQMESPAGLAILASDVTKVRIRLLNHSPETDGLVLWWTHDTPDKIAGSARYAMKPDSPEWQDVICHVDGRWSGTIGRIAIVPATLWWRGDIWIDSIAITDGPAREPVPRPDVCSMAVVPGIQIPGIANEPFLDAFKVLDECLVTDVPAYGMTRPFMGPGGAYGANWWALDTSLTLAGAMWVNQPFAEGVIENFMDVQDQNPDGRIDLYGGSTIRGQVGSLSSLPRYFEVACDIARRSNRAEFRETVLQSMQDYLGYWIGPAKRDARTGLITAIFEETFSEQLSDPQSLAAVDLNVAVAVGCRDTAKLARIMGRVDVANRYELLFREMRDAINEHLWNAEEMAYKNLDVRDMSHREALLCTTFDPFRQHIAPQERVVPLLERLQDTAQFNWGVRPLTTIAMLDPQYMEATGPYNATAWHGDVWTFRNIPVIEGLRDVGRPDLAAGLSWATIRAFNGNYAEYLVPSTGSGEGVARYGWTAAQYVQTIIEHLFGVDFDATRQRIRIIPMVPQDLWGQELQLENLILPAEPESRLSVSVLQTSAVNVSINATIQPELPGYALDLGVPTGPHHPTQCTGAAGGTLHPEPICDNYQIATGVHLPTAGTVTLEFH